MRSQKTGTGSFLKIGTDKFGEKYQFSFTPVNTLYKNAVLEIIYPQSTWWNINQDLGVEPLPVDDPSYPVI